jgi:hypothetical protein
MTSNEHLEPIQKTGLWVLKDWEIRTGSVTELIVEALRNAGTPMDIDALCDYVERERGTVVRATVASMVSAHPDLFRRIGRGNVALREWRNDWQRSPSRPT